MIEKIPYGTTIRAESSDAAEGEILALQTVKLSAGDIGFRIVFNFKGMPHILAKVLPLGINKPKNREEALNFAQRLINTRSDLVKPFKKGDPINYL